MSNTASTTISRRSWWCKIAAVLVVLSAVLVVLRALNAPATAGVRKNATTTTDATAAATATDNTLMFLYYGLGCFWHIQHEFVRAERELLGRNDHELTSRTGYAGGKSTGSQGRVCYHNWRGIADYGKLGHAEVVGMVIPESAVGDFAKVYFSLFDPKTKDRVDVNDRGGEYRSLLGLLGGTDHIHYAKVETAANEAGFALITGKGNDPDTFGKAVVYVYDTNEFPFYQAEVYHQYHNDFLSPAYGKEYNGLARLAREEGRIQPTGRPEGW